MVAMRRKELYAFLAVGAIIIVMLINGSSSSSRQSDAHAELRAELLRRVQQGGGGVAAPVVAAAGPASVPSRNTATRRDDDDGFDALIDRVRDNADAMKRTDFTPPDAPPPPPPQQRQQQPAAPQRRPSTITRVEDVADPDVLEGLARLPPRPPAGPASPVQEWGADFLLPVATTPRNEFATTYKCYRSVDWAEICIYKNLCHDGNMVVFFDESKEERTLITRHFRIGDDAVGHHTFDPYPRPPPASQGLPNNGRAKGYYRHPKVLAGGDPNTQITWSKDALWVAEPEYRGFEIQHPFFWSHSVFALWEARFSNSTWGSPFPPMKLVVMPVPPNVDFNEWNKGTLDLLVQEDTRVMFGKELNEAKVGPSNLLCAKQAIVIGNKPSMFSGIASCYAFRSAMYGKIGITGADRVKKERFPPHHLVIWSRKGRRGFENLPEIIQLVESYKLNYTLVQGHGTFREQVELMSKAGVLLLGHGAAATNTIFQPHRSVLIEVFPYLRKRFGFQNIAQLCGNFYMPIFSWKKPEDNERMWGPRFRWKCDHQASPNTNHEEECDQAQKESNILVPLDVLEQTLIDAFDTIGKRIYKGGEAPIRPSRPPEMKPESGIINGY